jgi:hypothetical protein
MIEIMRFQLTAGSSLEAFTAADRHLQSAFAYHQPGLLRRTTAVGADGHWIVIDLWRSETEADAASERFDHDPVAAAFMSFVDRTTLHIDRYATLD